MLIGPDSPFVKLPRDLESRQALFLDGIRFAAEMTHLAYYRLANTLYSLSSGDTLDGFAVGQGTVSALLDAWSMVDSINRLRDLQGQMPGLSKRTGYKVFMHRTEPYAGLRNVVQHLNIEIQEMARGQQPVWGTLRWFALLDAEGLRGRSCVLAAGHLMSGQHPIVNPAGQVVRSLVDQVTLTCKGIEASLTEGMGTVEGLIRAMEPELEKQFVGLPRTGTDTLIMAEMQFFDPTNCT